MMAGHATTIAYLTVTFLALAGAGLIVLRRQKSVRMRVIVFLLFCLVCVRITLWATSRWQLLMGEAATAWVVALLLLGAILGLGQLVRRPSRD